MRASALEELVFLSDPQLSVGGRRAFCVRTRIHTPEEGPPRYRAQVCEVGIGADDAVEALRTLAEGPEGSDHPRPSPDGRQLAFLSQREGSEKPQVHLLDLARGGEARTATRLRSGAHGFVWHPNGDALLVFGSDEKPAPEGDEVVARAVTRLRSKSDGLPFPGLRTAPPAQAWYLSADGEACRMLTDFPDGVVDGVWAPDGTLWLLAAADLAEADAWKATLWRVEPDARGAPGGAPERVAGPLFRPTSLAISADDGTLAWLAPVTPGDPSAVTGLWTLQPGSGVPELRSGDTAAEPSVGGDARHGRYPNRPVAWNGGWLVNANREGASAPALLSADGDLAPRIGGPRVATSFAHAGGRTLALVETPQRPGELVLVDTDGSERPCSNENAGFANRWGLLPASEVRRAPNGGDGVPWWRLDPPRPRQDAAVVIQVHGGPHTNVGYGFSFEFQLLAARGYAVVWANPRGSSSYGGAHQTASIGAYGSVDAEDVLAVVDDALSEHGTGDAPVHLTGGSYGGFMTNWLVTRTDRFRSAVTQRSICNWLSFYGTSDIGYLFAEHEVQGTPWNDTERLWAQSPLARVEHVTTPILVLHADADHRCPVEQAEQWFVALSRIGKAETRLVRFPDEGHELSRSGRPDRRIRRLDEIVDWFETHP